jgi:hypothetical protein
VYGLYAPCTEAQESSEGTVKAKWLRKVRLRTIMTLPPSQFRQMAEETGNFKGAAARLPSGTSHGPRPTRRDNRYPWRKALRCAAAVGGGLSLPCRRSRIRLRILPSRTAKPPPPWARRLREEAQTRQQVHASVQPQGTTRGYREGVWRLEAASSGRPGGSGAARNQTQHS